MNFNKKIYAIDDVLNVGKGIKEFLSEEFPGSVFNEEQFMAVIHNVIYSVEVVKVENFPIKKCFLIQLTLA